MFTFTEKSWRILSLFIMMAAAMVLPSASCFGAPPSSIGELLKQTEGFYQSVQAFTARFTQITTSSVSSTLKTEASGILYYQKPRQMRWEYERPEPQVFTANQQLAWLYVPSEKQMSLFDAQSLFQSPLAQTFFDGIVELRKNFDVTLESKMSDTEASVLRLVPKSTDPNIQFLFLWIDQTSHRISKIESHDALGNVNLIILENVNTSTAVDPALFQLTIPPAVNVLDMEGKQLTTAEIDQLKKKLSK